MSPPNELPQTLLLVCLLINIASSIGIVFLNKYIYITYGFPNITMTGIHFFVTSLGLVVCKHFDIFAPKRLDLKRMIPLCLTFCGFVVFTNLSLQKNTVGTYQLFKTMTMPVILLIQSLMYNKTYSVQVKLTVIPIIVGVFVNSSYDVRFNIVGTAFAIVGVFVTSFYQVWIGASQAELQVNSMQLLFYQAPMSALLLLFIAPIFEPPIGAHGWLVQGLSVEAVLVVLLSGVVAFSVNLSIFWIIGNTSPLTYNMVGHTKLCVTLIGGVLLFQDPLQFNQVIGIILTLTGVISYTYVKIDEQNRAKPITMTKP